MDNLSALVEWLASGDGSEPPLDPVRRELVVNAGRELTQAEAQKLMPPGTAPAVIPPGTTIASFSHLPSSPVSFDAFEEIECIAKMALAGETPCEDALQLIANLCGTRSVMLRLRAQREAMSRVGARSIKSSSQNIGSELSRGIARRLVPALPFKILKGGFAREAAPCLGS